jgi:hypothetical protein
LPTLLGGDDPSAISDVLLEHLWQLSSKKGQDCEEIIFLGLLYDSVAIVKRIVRKRRLRPFDIIDTERGNPVRDVYMPSDNCALLESAAILGTAKSFTMILSRSAVLTPNVTYHLVLGYAAANLEPEIFLDSSWTRALT